MRKHMIYRDFSEKVYLEDYGFSVIDPQTNAHLRGVGKSKKVSRRTSPENYLDLYELMGDPRNLNERILEGFNLLQEAYH